MIVVRTRTYASILALLGVMSTLTICLPARDFAPTRALCRRLVIASSMAKRDSVIVFAKPCGH
jgi:hypothetical protein